MTCSPWTQNYQVAYFSSTILRFFGWKSSVCGATVWIIFPELVLASVSYTFYLLGMNLSVSHGG